MKIFLRYQTVVAIFCYINPWKQAITHIQFFWSFDFFCYPNLEKLG